MSGRRRSSSRGSRERSSSRSWFSRTLVFHAIALNITLVTIAAVIVILIQSRDFVRMVNALARSEALSDENLRLANIDSLTDLPNRRAFFS